MVLRVLVRVLVRVLGLILSILAVLFGAYIIYAFTSSAQMFGAVLLVIGALGVTLHTVLLSLWMKSER